MIKVVSASNDIGSLTELVSAFGTGGLAIVAAISAVVAFINYRSAKQQKSEEIQITRTSRAKEIWSNYLRIAFDYPDLTERSWTEHTAEAKVSKNYSTVEKYEWLVSIMFFAAEEILVISDELAWKVTIKNQIGYFREYVFGFGKQFNATYSAEIQELIEEVNVEIATAEASGVQHRYEKLSWRLSNA